MMHSKFVSCLFPWVLASVAGLDILLAQGARITPKFVADDPVWIDDDTVADAAKFAEVDLSETFDLIAHQFGSPGDNTPMRALNVNSVDAVPDSSWFTNRMGKRAPTIRELLRGANKFEPAEAATWTQWVVVEGKSAGGFQPGFRAERLGDPGQMYQLEVDPVAHPQLATGAEFIGTLIYHALGYNVEDFYLIKVLPKDIAIAEDATIKDASGRRKFTRHDLNNVLRVAARDDHGRVYLSAQRRGDGEDRGHFQYYGTRSDDPNDIYPHEHRRELRANRVFAAWLAHDDSRALNTRNVRIKTGGRSYVRHYMHDFGATLGSATRYSEPPTNNHEYFIGRRSSWRQLLTLGLFTPRPLRADRPQHVPASVGWYESGSFDPVRWRPNYPNPAFSNLQPDDAFWGARLVAQFSDEAIGAIVASVGYDDPEAATYLTRTMISRRDIVARAWLNAVNPIVDVALGVDGALSFTNAAVAARVATHGTYTIEWARFDNMSGAVENAGTETRSEPKGVAPRALLQSADFIVATIASQHVDQPGWTHPIRAFFRRDGSGWTTVGLYRRAQ